MYKTNITHIMSLKSKSDEKLSHKINTTFTYEGEEKCLPKYILKLIIAL